ncbi:TonB-dependent receptor [Haliea sp.]|jgi:iron complex outermembrane receptor protein|uniref:TonB-dependent receptor n=2 Tax=Haliea TaxID=475794 RepID=UPI000C52DA7D|nr:TonB-dependent receptor [Haliea sp.]MAY92711.1 TonB-dependent receptor [Haliea sp.]MBP70090.1 TonB-dependent receptor [Haliea sp.]HCD57272.1 TonB-dependent receptor [Halieaceae bacterium]|tara:strand:- start:385 stop:2736 length:2352 start_codon:yes stop_codon:yes gene_type:complete
MTPFRKSLLAAAIVAVLPVTAFAQLEEVVVTATKREVSAQDLPFSINAQSEADIRRLGATTLEDLSRNVAGLAIQNLGPGQSQVSIRGVSAGQVVRDQPGVKEQVGVYLDETVISLSLFTPDLDLYDLNRVETLRGPQGTLFGSGSVGGTIRFITNQPDFETLEGSVEANLNTIEDGDMGGHFKGMINIPMNDRAALRVVGYGTEYGGWVDALREGGGISEDVNSGGRYGGRIALAVQPTDNLTITPRVVFQKIETDGFNREDVYNLFANPYTTTRPPVQLAERQQYLRLDEAFEDETMIADLVVNWSLDAVDVTYAGSYVDREILASRDASALSGSVSVDLGFPESAVLLPSNLRDTTDLQQTTHELRFASNSDGAFNWVFGGFYSDVERTYAQRLPTPGYDVVTDQVLGAGTAEAVSNGYGPDSPYNSDLPYDIEQTALFGEVSYDVTERLNVTLGGRYYDFEEERRFTTGGLFSNGDDQVDSTSSDGFNPRLLVSYDVSDDMTVNAQASQGFRLGGVNDPLNVPLCDAGDLQTFGNFQSYEDETLWNYELGFKSEFERVRFNAAIFYTDIEDLQVTLDAGSCSSRISFNVPEAHTLGVEWELVAYPSELLMLTLSGSMLEAEFDSTVVDSEGNVLGGVEDGNRLASVPEFQVSASATYTFPVDAFGSDEMYVSAVLQHVGDRFTQPSDQVEGAGNFVSGLPFGGATGNEVTAVDLELDAYEQLNLSAGIIWSTFEAVVYVNNVTDENAELSFDRERGGRARLAFRNNQPRTVGITLRKFF